MADLDDLPNLTDGADPVNTGSVVDEAFWDDVQAALTGECRGTTDPTRTPAQTTDEVLAARGAFGSLLLRLNDWEAQQYIAPDVLAQSWLCNLVGDAEWLLWPNGDASAPAYAALSGAGAAVARCGSGLADTTAPEYGIWCAKVTSGAGAAGVLTKTIIPAAVVARLDGLGAFVGGDAVEPRAFVLARVKCSVGSKASLMLDNGLSQSSSSYHTGSGNWETLWINIPITDSITKLEASCIMGLGGGSAYFAPICVAISRLDAPRMFLPGQWVRREKDFQIQGNVTTGTRKFGWHPRRPGIVTDVQLSAGTAPTGQALIVDVNTWDGAALTSMFSTRPQIAAAATDGGAQPDTTYARRCLYPHFGGTKVAGGLLTIDVDQIGSGAAGADLTITIGYLEAIRPLEGYMDYNSL